jgi:hypothetical protein
VWNSDGFHPFKPQGGETRKSTTTLPKKGKRAYNQNHLVHNFKKGDNHPISKLKNSSGLSIFLSMPKK